jgi:hypothetical protein
LDRNLLNNDLVYARPCTPTKMKQKNEIIQDLEDNEIFPRLLQIKSLQGEIDVLQYTVSTLRGLDQQSSPIVKENNQGDMLANYPGYPLNGTLIEKYAYLEDKTLKVWRMVDMWGLIQQIEGKRQSTKTLKSARQATHYFLKTRELIRIQYGGKRAFTFFTTRLEWIEKENDGTNATIRLLSQHEPDPKLLSELTEAQRNSISWGGIN